MFEFAQIHNELAKLLLEGKPLIESLKELIGSMTIPMNNLFSFDKSKLKLTKEVVGDIDFTQSLSHLSE
jgi:hypothetical protein